MQKFEYVSLRVFPAGKKEHITESPTVIVADFYEARFRTRNEDGTENEYRWCINNANEANALYTATKRAGCKFDVFGEIRTDKTPYEYERTTQRGDKVKGKAFDLAKVSYQFSGCRGLDPVGQIPTLTMYGEGETTSSNAEAEDHQQDL